MSNDNIAQQMVFMAIVAVIAAALFGNTNPEHVEVAVQSTQNYMVSVEQLVSALR